MTLREWLVANNMMQRDLAARLKISEGYMSKLVNRRAYPRKAVVDRIHEATNGQVGTRDL